MKAALALFLALMGGAALAAEPAPDLPPADVVTRVLATSPVVEAANARIRVETANRDALTAGSYEWNLRVGGQQRRVDPRPGRTEHFGEWNAALERPVRLPGKAALDAELGAAGLAMAETALGDTFHEARRTLLAGWFAWLRERAAAAQWAEQVALLTRQSDAVGRRQQLGDAARLEAVQAEAALAQARTELARAQARADVVAEDLRRRFPGLPLTAPAEAVEPQPVPGNEAEWMEAILAASHELELARDAVRRAQAAAGRQGRDRTPDPVFGVQASSERGGEERVLGAYVSIALPGRARRAAADAALAEADVAARQEAAALQKVSAQAATLFRSASAAFTAWQNARDAAASLGHASDMSARAYALGEGSLNELLLARRQANEAGLTARLMQLEAQELRYRLQLDAHRLWAGDDPARPAPPAS